MASLALGVQQPRFESKATASGSLVPCWMKAYAERKKAQSQLGGRSMALKTLRLVFALLVCLTFIFTLGTELTYRLGMHGTVNQALNKTLFIWPTHKAALFSGSHHLPVNFNQTLLSYAAIQIGEADERQQIQDLLNATGSSYDVKQRSKLSHPRYADYWSVFHRALQSWAQNKHFEPTIMTQLIDLVKVPIDQHYMATNQTNLSDIHIGNRTDQEVYLFDSDNKTTLLKHHQNEGYRSCAVVGNSGILLQRPHGPLIDSHEMVIRLNNARTSGFEPNVGSKTTLAFVNSNIFHSCAMRPDCFCHSYGETVPVIMYICQAVHFMDYARCNASKKVPLLVTDARFDNLCARIVKYYSLRNFLVTTGKHPEEWSSAHDGNMFHYSSGMQAVMLALGICEKVSMFGFGKSDRAKHHYHTNQRFELGLHDYEAEYQFYADLVRGSQYIPFLSEAGIKLPPVQIYF